MEVKADIERTLDPRPGPSPGPGQEPAPDPDPGVDRQQTPTASDTTLRLSGSVPPEIWNRIGIKLLPKLRSGKELNASVEISVTVDSGSAANMVSEIEQILNDLGLGNRIEIDNKDD